MSSYANSPRGRAVLIGTALVLSAAMLVRPVMFLVGCALVLVLGQRQLARLFPARQSVADHADTPLRFAPGFLVAAGTTWMLFAAHLPMDELLRHILARGWGYDYASHYGNHFVDQHWSYWIGFDWAVGAVHAATGDILTTSRIVRAAIFVAVGSAVVAAVNRAHPDRAIRFAATAAILVGFLWLRLNLGRPEVLFTGLIISALALPRLVWLGFFLLLVPTYWLAPVYAVGAMLLGRHGDPWRGRLLRNLGVALAGVAASVAFWWHYSDGTVLHTVTLLGQVVQNHAEASRPIGEMMPLTEGTRSPLVLGLMGLLVVTAWKCGNSGAAAAARSTIVACLAVACYFCLPDYVRYAPTIWSLLLLAMLMIAGDVRTPSAARPWILAGLAMLVMLGMRPPKDGASDRVLEHLAVPAGSRVLTSFNSSSYFAAAANPRSVITPIFDVNGTRPPFRQLVMELSLGRLDCVALLQLDAFEYVVESTFKGDAPACLHLLRVDGPHRLWQVNKESP